MSIIVKKWGGNLVGDFFEHTKIGKKFRRIVGGFAWPGKKPGFVVVVGEELDPDPTTKKRHQWVVGETEDFNVENLFRRAVEFSKIYHVEVFCGDTEKQGMMSLLHQFNSSSRKLNLPGLSLREAPHVRDEDSFATYVQIIKGHIEPEKYLHFGESNKLPGLLLELNPEDTSQDAHSFPAIVALGSAVAYLDIYQPLSPLKTPQQNVAKSYAVNLDWSKWSPPR